MPIFETTSVRHAARLGPGTTPGTNSHAEFGRIAATGTCPPLVLVVDDHEDSRAIARLVLESAGFRVAEAKTGFEGFRMGVELRPSVILLDMILPGLDGWEIARLLRANADVKNATIVAVTALASADDRDRALQLQLQPDQEVRQVGRHHHRFRSRRNIDERAVDVEKQRGRPVEIRRCHPWPSRSSLKAPTGAQARPRALLTLEKPGGSRPAVKMSAQAPGSLPERLARFIENQTTRATLEQFPAELLLKGANLVAESGVREGHSRCSLGDAAGLGHGYEASQSRKP